MLGRGGAAAGRLMEAAPHWREGCFAQSGGLGYTAAEGNTRLALERGLQDLRACVLASVARLEAALQALPPGAPASWSSAPRGAPSRRPTALGEVGFAPVALGSHSDCAALLEQHDASEAWDTARAGAGGQRPGEPPPDAAPEAAPAEGGEALEEPAEEPGPLRTVATGGGGKARPPPLLGCGAAPAPFGSRLNLAASTRSSSTLSRKPSSRAGAEASTPRVCVAPSTITDIVLREDRKARRMSQEVGIRREALRQLAAMSGSKPEKGPFCRRLVESGAFELLSTLAILSSSILVGVEVQYSATHLNDPLPPIFRALRDFYSMFFLAEYLCRIAADGPYIFFYMSQDKGWAWFDAVVVIAGLVDFSFDMLLLTQSGSKPLVDVRQMRMVRMCRGMRILRTLRVQRFAGHLAPLRTLVYSIAVTLRSLGWAMVLLLLVIYVTGVVICQGAVDALAGGSVDEDLRKDLGDYWVPLDEAMFSLFQTVTGGLNWRDAMMPLLALPPPTPWVLPTFVGFVTFAMLNVVTGVFCSCAIETAQRNPEVIAMSVIKNRQVYVDNLKALFLKTDQDASGLISLAELERLIADDVLHAHLCALGIAASDAWTLFKLLDTEKKGEIDINEFVRGCERLEGNAKGVSMASVAEELRALSRKVATFMRFTEEHLTAMSLNLATKHGDETGRCSHLCSPPERHSSG